MPFQFRADPRDGSDTGLDPCGLSCCCQQMRAVPGDTNGVAVNYLGWVAPLGGRGLTNPTEIAITKLTPGDNPTGVDEQIKDAFGNVIGEIPTPPVTAGAASADGIVSIPAGRVSIRGSVLSFAVAVTGGATPGDVYRIMVRQAAMDCDAAFYWHTSCYDLAIVKC